jgi:hypothetical protein
MGLGLPKLRPSRQKNLTTIQCIPQWSRCALIEEYSHGLPNEFQNLIRGLLEHGLDLLQAHTRKPLYKLIERCAVMEVVEQSRDWYTCARKARRAAHDVGVLGDSRDHAQDDSPSKQAYFGEYSPCIHPIFPAPV